MKPMNAETTSLERTCPQCSYRTSRAVSRCPVCEVPLLEQERSWTRSRRTPRLILIPPLRAELDGGLEVAVLEISSSGARLEHRQPLTPGDLSTLTLLVDPDAEALRLPGRVVRSWIHQLEEEGDPDPIYHSGLEFQDVPPEVVQSLAAYILGGIANTHSGPLRGTLEPPPY